MLLYSASSGQSYTYKESVELIPLIPKEALTKPKNK